MTLNRRTLLGLVLGLALLSSATPAEAAVRLGHKGSTDYVILRETGCPEPEANAARELAMHLEKIVGAEFPILSPGDEIPSHAILVGSGPTARKQFPEVPWDRLGDEEIVIRTKGSRLLLAGGRPRGTLYAVSRFLQDHCGVRWWTPWASRIPSEPDLRVPRLRLQEAPAFEARDPFWHPAFDRTWAVRNLSNSQNAHIPPEWGGAVRYKGFVHTFYPLVPPEKHFAEHPEWYSLVKGKRTTDHAQLCLTNPQLRDFLVDRVREWLKESPDASLISISQNDWYGACECESCKALDDAEGSHAGTLLSIVNHVAERLGPEFPKVAFDTLAYQYTRKPPKTLRPLPNVVVRLCSIECNFREPLDHPSNAAFAEDIRGWSKICNRLYLWDYTTDFAHYVQPHPNWFVLGPNLRFFHTNQVRGMFEQGAYQSPGSEMSELRAWVLARLLWNPFQDDRALIREFVEGYYGTAAAPHILGYLELMVGASAGYKLGCFSKTDTPFHQFTTLAEAEKLWDQAEKAAAGDANHVLRIRVARLPLRYVWLSRWVELRKECREAAATWPLPESRKEVATAFARLANGPDSPPWARITHLNESGLTVDKFVARFAEDPAP
jgi:hypothetical protein